MGSERTPRRISRGLTAAKLAFMLRSERLFQEPPPAGSVTPADPPEFDVSVVEPSLAIVSLLLVSVIVAVVLLKMKPVVSAVFVWKKEPLTARTLNEFVTVGWYWQLVSTVLPLM